MNDEQRQPPAFSLLFLVSALERGGSYALHAVLSVYLLKHLELGNRITAEILATMTPTLALAPLVGGYLSDRFLGQQKAVMTGGISTVLGMLLLLHGDHPYIAMGLLVCGSAFFTPAIPSILGDLYGRGDPRRDAGFTLFLLADHIGILLMAALALDLPDRALPGAAVLSALAVIAFGVRQRLLRAEGYPGTAVEAPAARLSRKDLRTIALFSAGTVIFVCVSAQLWPLVQPQWKSLHGDIQVLVVLNLLGVSVVIERISSHRSSRAWTPVEWQRIGVLGILILYAVIVGAGRTLAVDPVMQAATRQSAAMGLGRSFLLNLLGYRAGVPFVVLGLCFARLWRYIDDSSRPMSGMIKIGIGGILCGVSMGTAWLAGESANTGIIVLFSVIGTAGELVVASIGMSMVTKLAPHRNLTWLMALWMLASTSASPMTGAFQGPGGHSIAPPIAAALVLGSGIALWLLTPRLKTWMHGAEDAWRADKPVADVYRSEGGA